MTLDNSSSLFTFHFEQAHFDPRPRALPADLQRTMTISSTSRGDGNSSGMSGGRAATATAAVPVDGGCTRRRRPSSRPTHPCSSLLSTQHCSTEEKTTTTTTTTMLSTWNSPPSPPSLNPPVLATMRGVRGRERIRTAGGRQVDRPSVHFAQRKVGGRLAVRWGLGACPRAYLGKASGG